MGMRRQMSLKPTVTIHSLTQEEIAPNIRLHPSTRKVLVLPCLWDGGDINRKGSCLVSQKMACRPKDQGGLAIINLRAQNTALLLKFLDKFYNNQDLPWVKLTWQKLYRRQVPLNNNKPKGSFWWKAIIRLAENFFMISSCVVKNGLTVNFWNDSWNVGVLKWKYPDLYEFAHNKNIIVQSFVSTDVENLLWLPLSMTASSQLTELQGLLQQFNLGLESPDIRNYIWGSNAYSVQKGLSQVNWGMQCITMVQVDVEILL